MLGQIAPKEWRPKDVPSLEQEADQAVRAEKENTLVIAGPGAGKTELLAQRAAYLLETGQCRTPRRILAISFKRDAARNLRDRVRRRIGPELARRFDSFTFDAFCKSLLDRFLNAVPADFRPTRDYVIDLDLGVLSQKQKAKFGALLNSVADDSRGLTIARLQGLSVVGLYDDHFIGQPFPATFPEQASLETAAALRIWQSLLRSGNRSALNFPMIGRLAELLLRANPRILRALRATYAFVFLDEFQDTTNVHYEFTKTAFQGSHTLLTAVGDEKQRIMIWAGALRGVFAQYELDFSARVHRLKMNYRSAPGLVRVQRHLIAALEPKAPPPQAADKGQEGEGECRLLIFSNHEREATHLADLISKWIHNEGIPAREVCILTRNRPDKYTETLHHALAERDVPARIENSLQDLLAEPLTTALIHFLRLAAERRAPDSWAATVALLLEARGIDDNNEHEARDAANRLAHFQTTLRSALDESAGEESIAAVLAQIADFIGPAAFERLYPQYRQGTYYLDNMRACARELAQSRQRAATWKAALDDFEGVGAVPIMTVHKSKGLEYRTVIFVGLEDSALWGYKQNPEEETCGFFVAFSRAKKRVLFTFCETRPNPRYGQPEGQGRDSIALLYKLLEGAGVALERID
jgi:DNA helicase II / ATP-dependent DNA helicase PcrA